MSSPAPAMQDQPRLAVVHGEAAVLDGQWASDHWDAGRLGVPARRGRGTARFGAISQQWLRDPVKRWSRFRLATGCAFATIDAGALALTRFSRFLAAHQPQAAGASAITRAVLEDYMSWLVTEGYSAPTRALSLSMIRVFFEACHRHGWLPGLAASATIYVEELPFHHEEIARFIPEFVMAQLESDEALAKIPRTTTRNLVVVIMETGLRGGDACSLPFNPVLTDSSGWPSLRFEAVKVRAEQLIPLSAKAAAAIRAQQDYVRQRWPAGSPWLFPGIAGNDDGSRPYSHSNFTKQLTHWQRIIGLHDETGKPVTVTAHQFRHTLVICTASEPYEGRRVRRRDTPVPYGYPVLVWHVSYVSHVTELMAWRSGRSGRCLPLTAPSSGWCWTPARRAPGGERLPAGAARGGPFAAHDPCLCRAGGELPGLVRRAGRRVVLGQPGEPGPFQAFRRGRPWPGRAAAFGRDGQRHAHRSV